MTNKVDSCLRKYREAAGISQRELARLLNVHHSNVSFWERTAIPPRSELLPEIARILRVSVDDLLGIENNRSNPQTQGGKLSQIFQQVAGLSRSKQKRIIGVVEALLAQENGI